MKTNAKKMSNDEKVQEKVINAVKEDKQPHCGHSRTKRYYAWISNNEIKMEIYSNDSEAEMWYGEWTFAL